MEDHKTESTNCLGSKVATLQANTVRVLFADASDEVKMEVIGELISAVDPRLVFESGNCIGKKLRQLLCAKIDAFYTVEKWRLGRWMEDCKYLKFCVTYDHRLSYDSLFYLLCNVQDFCNYVGKRMGKFNFYKKIDGGIRVYRTHHELPDDAAPFDFKRDVIDLVESGQPFPVIEKAEGWNWHDW